MSVLIKGMEMPKSCDVCPFVGTNDDLMSDDYRYLYCGFPYMGQYVTDYEATRHADCPLVPLPEGHGRLIDGDAPIRVAYYDGTIHKTTASRLLCEHSLLDLPKTIVPAEGGADNG